ncbi:MAG: hypothetical protein PVI43_06640, partial [Candidatus Bathyarchaeota archaeon]
MQKNWAIFAVLVSSILLISVVSYVFFVSSSNEDSFYVGVTYCGESPEEAKQLIDKVKDYTNLFVLQSGSLQYYPDNITAIGDYAVTSGMHYMVYFGTESSWLMRTWRDTYSGQWDDKFLGVYFGDELGGKMLDGDMYFYDQPSQSSLWKYADGTVTCYKTEGNGSKIMTYHSDGLIT